MIRECIICGRQFEGRPNATLCSGACRLESKKNYMKKYREEHSEKLAEEKRKWYCNKKGVAFKPKDPALKKEPPQPPKLEPIVAKNPANYYIARQSKIICQSTKWGRKYLKTERLDQIVMLSAELSKLGIERLSYGYLSAMRTIDRDRYLRLLKSVVDAKEASA